MKKKSYLSRYLRPHQPCEPKVKRGTTPLKKIKKIVSRRGKHHLCEIKIKKKLLRCQTNTTKTK